ncbi:MAG TPA: MlaE family lipid ABC transporter permease subunit [Steroidobacteraceae bacterium]|nr:MlaE family lipid ABC transporter permease subunit [Steroidobacteraceae bacterium]
MFLDSNTDRGALTLHVRGRWLIENLAAIEAEFAQVDVTRARTVAIDASRLEELDLSGGWALHQRIELFRERGIAVDWKPDPPAQVRFIEGAIARAREQAAQAPVDEALDFAQPVRALGRWTVGMAGTLRAGLGFLGRICVVLGSALLSFRRLRLTAVARHVYDTGVSAIPIVSLIAFLISVIIAYMGANELRRFGAEIFVVDLVTIGVLRELGVLLTAIIVAGRSGSAFAAEIGVMKLDDEVDALVAIGTNPIEVLVVPRILGLVISLPLLTVIADAVGLTGGGILCYYLVDIPPAQYIERVQQAIAPTTFWVGIIKAPVFAFLIGFIGAARGMQVRESSRELGRLTTVAVVQSIFLVILADALFAVVFLELDI